MLFIFVYLCIGCLVGLVATYRYHCYDVLYIKDIGLAIVYILMAMCIWPLILVAYWREIYVSSKEKK